MRVLFLQHHDDEPPGRLGAMFRDHGFRVDVRRPDRDGIGALPPDLDNVHGVVLLGGPQNVGDDLDWLRAEADLVRRAHEAELPVVGICLGAQVIAAALGGEVAPMGEGECGFADVSITSAGQTETVLAGVPWRSSQYHAHEREVTALPPESTHLASSDACAHQAFCVGLRTYGFQYHFECDRGMLDAFARRYGAHGCDDALYARYARVGDRHCTNLATYCFPFDRLLAV